MELFLVQVRPCKLIESLQILKSRLPDGLAERVSTPDVRPGAPLPHQVMCLPDASEKEAAEIRAAVENLPHDALVVQQAHLAVCDPPAGDGIEIEDTEEFISLIRPDLANLPRAASDPAEEIWAAVLKRAASGVPFVQEGYEGYHAKAYANVIQQFDRIVPHQDGGKNLKPSDIERLKPPRRPKRAYKEAWNEVVEDLRDLLRSFEIAREWFDSGGALRNYVRDQMFADMGFMLRLNTQYGLCDPAARVSLSCDIAMALTGKLLQSANPMVGFVFGLLWKVVTAERPGGGILTAKIKEMEIALHDVYEQSIQSVEKALVALVRDWGNLSGFVAQVRAGTIVWPDDAAPIRRAHAVGYHTACLKTLLKLKSDTETHPIDLHQQTWGVVQYQQGCAKTAIRDYKPGKGILRCAAQDGGCDSYWNDNWFFGSVRTRGNPQWGPEPPEIKLAPPALANKFFLAGTDADPGLGISDSFFDDPKVRAPWGLHSVRTKNAGRVI